ncbi:hypothetical protein Q4574_09740 [Aliiglaciecola sp. 3_MG-2023]|uniref:hypothetical protein n=1 Tax=Aliiglaciecola sp. 3_MG-2023 TaxID=3062644 RepID=UPI0026E23C77|nr:hypothetical protein [Aliiglaciecola sp. 3_MG-2023]MDO6693566.1 hypothetical protein [Aliiglaciecola sp. 3_MG-2023]
MVDIQKLNGVLKTAKQILNENQNLNKAEEILLALITKSLELIEESVPINNICFTYKEIYSFVWSDNVDADKARRVVNSHKDNLKELLSAESKFSKSLLEKGHNRHLEINSNDSKGGAKAFWYLTLSDINSPNFEPSNQISYKPISIQKPYFWVKPLLKVSLQGKGAFFFVCIPVIGIIGIPFLIYLLGTTNYVWVSIISVFFLYFLVRAIFVIYELMEKGVSSVPDFMVRFKTSNTLFVVTRDKSIKDEKEPKSIEIVQYEASCPKCGDIVFIEHGIKEFKGRYVGRCTLAPSEHQFSFDHVLKIGKCLR